MPTLHSFNGLLADQVTPFTLKAALEDYSVPGSVAGFPIVAATQLDPYILITIPELDLDTYVQKALDFRIQIIAGGAVGVATFQYSLNGGGAWSGTLTSAAWVQLGADGTAEFRSSDHAPGNSDTYQAGATFLLLSEALVWATDTHREWLNIVHLNAAGTGLLSPMNRIPWG